RLVTSYLLRPRTLRSSLFPYTTLFRSLGTSESAVKSRLLYARRKIESKVRDLEKKGTKLYGLAPLPFLLWLLRKGRGAGHRALRSEEHTSELQSRFDLVCRLLLEKKNN